MALEKKLLDILFDRTPMVIAVLDQEARLIRFNPTWVHLTAQYSPSVESQIVPGVNYFDLFPGTEPVMRPLFERVRTGESVTQEALRLDSGDFTSYWDISLTPLFEDEGGVDILLVAGDATGRVNALMALGHATSTLHERETRLDLVMRGTNDGIWDWDLESNRVYYSPRWKAMLGYSEEEITGQEETWRELIHPDDVAKAEAALQTHFTGQTPYYHLEHRLRHKDGSYRWILTRGISVRDADGKPYRMVGSHTDITEQKQAEENLQHQLAFEDVITTISTNFINLEPGKFDSGIHWALQTLGKFDEIDRSYVFLFSADGKSMEKTHEWCAEGIEPQHLDIHALPVSTLPWLTERIKKLQVVHVPDVDALPPDASQDAAACRAQSIQSLIFIPMAFRGAAIGFVGLDTLRSKKTWSEDNIALLKIFSEILVNALEHKRSQAIQAGQRQFLELLAAGGSLSETLHTLVQIIEEQWPGMQGLVLLLDEDGKHLHIGASVTLPEEYTQSIEGLEIGPMVGSCGTATYYGKRVIVEDIATDPRWDGLRDLAVKYGLGACWSEPVISSGGQVIGTFAMYYRHRRSPTQAELRTIEIGAHLAGVAIEHKRAQNELQRAYQMMEQRVEERTRQLSTLLDLSHDLASTLELEPQLGLILDQLKSVIDYRGASIFKREEDLLKVVAYRGPIPQEIALQIEFPLSKAGANRKVMEDREPVVIPDILGVTRLAKEFRETAGDQLHTTFSYLRSWMGVPLIVRDQVIGMLSLDHPEPNYYNSKSLNKLAFAFANQVAAAIENARLYQEEQERRREAEKRRQVAEGLRDILTILNSNRQLGEILESIVNQAIRLTGSNAGAIYRYDAQRQHLAIEAGCGLPDEMQAIQTVPAYRGGAVGAMLAREPYVLMDISRHLATAPARKVQESPGSWLKLLKDHFSAYIGIPLVIRDEIYGSLGLYYESPREFSEEEIGLVVAFADQAALAIENARLRTKAEQTAVAAERSRLARDLHDAVTQTLFSASLIAEVLPRLWERNHDEGLRRLEELRQLTRGALAEMRTLLLELRPSALIEAELGELFRHLGDAFTSRARVQVKFSIEGDTDLPPEVKVAFYRIAQEALNNIAKHAEATQAELAIRCHPDGLSMTIRDNGNGFDPAKISPEHLGLGIMKERADNIDAKLSITSKPGEGTQILVDWNVVSSRTLSSQGEEGR